MTISVGSKENTTSVCKKLSVGCFPTELRLYARLIFLSFPRYSTDHSHIFFAWFVLVCFVNSKTEKTYRLALLQSEFSEYGLEITV